MKRSAAKVVVFLLLGAIVNVAVAWVAGFVSRADPTIIRPFHYSSNLWFVRGQTDAEHVVSIRRVTSMVDDYIMRAGGISAAESIRSISYKEFSSSLSWGSPFSPMRIQTGIAPTDTRIRSEYTAGWPTRSMRFVERVTADPGRTLWPTSQSTEMSGATRLPSPLSALRADLPLPLHPIWPNFLLNTFFYALALAGLFIVAPKILRFLLHERRRRRGLCSLCAYPVGSSPVCTECGGAIYKR